MEDLKPEIIRRHQSGESIATIAAILNAEPSAVAAVVDMLGSQPPTVSFYADALPEKMILAGKGGVVKARHDFSERVAAIKASMAQQSSDAVIMRAFSIRDLLDSVETPGWLIDGVIPDNGVTLMHAAPKIGKTTVIAGWMKALERDGEWAGRKSVGAPVLLLSEEGGNTLYDPIMELKLDIDSAHQIAPIEYAPEGWDWPEALARSTLYAELCGIRLIIIDTLQTWSDANDTNSYIFLVFCFSLEKPPAGFCRGLFYLLTHVVRRCATGVCLAAMELGLGPRYIATVPLGKRRQRWKMAKTGAQRQAEYRLRKKASGFCMATGCSSRPRDGRSHCRHHRREANRRAKVSRWRRRQEGEKSLVGGGQ